MCTKHLVTCVPISPIVSGKRPMSLFSKNVAACGRWPVVRVAVYRGTTILTNKKKQLHFVEICL